MKKFTITVIFPDGDDEHITKENIEQDLIDINYIVESVVEVH